MEERSQLGVGMRGLLCVGALCVTFVKMYEAFTLNAMFTLMSV